LLLGGSSHRHGLVSFGGPSPIGNRRATSRVGIHLFTDYLFLLSGFGVLADVDMSRLRIVLAGAMRLQVSTFVTGMIADQPCRR